MITRKLLFFVSAGTCEFVSIVLCKENKNGRYNICMFKLPGFTRLFESFSCGKAKTISKRCENDRVDRDLLVVYFQFLIKRFRADGDFSNITKQRLCI